nr:Hpt domain-containing protein [Frigidibacter sp. ROC022]
MRDDVGEEEFPEVVQLFLDEVEAVLARLKARPAPETLEDDLHFVKGSALTLGFRALGEICQQGERDARAARFGAIDIPRLLSIYAASKAEFAARLGLTVGTA